MPGTAMAAHQPSSKSSAANADGAKTFTAEAQAGEESPLYKTDEFRMYCFKVLPCSKRFTHDWTTCPFAHPAEKAKRRDPRVFQYTGVACPEMKKSMQCPRGDACPFSHTVFEYWLHPSRYRTQLCNDGVNCRRKVCFFAHTLEELRISNVKVLSPELAARVPPGTADSFEGLDPFSMAPLEDVAAKTIHSNSPTSPLAAELWDAQPAAGSSQGATPMKQAWVQQGMQRAASMPVPGATELQQLQHLQQLASLKMAQGMAQQPQMQQEATNQASVDQLAQVLAQMNVNNGSSSHGNPELMHVFVQQLLASQQAQQIAQQQVQAHIAQHQLAQQAHIAALAAAAAQQHAQHQQLLTQQQLHRQYSSPDPSSHLNNLLSMSPSALAGSLVAASAALAAQGQAQSPVTLAPAAPHMLHPSQQPASSGMPLTSPFQAAAGAPGAMHSNNMRRASESQGPHGAPGSPPSRAHSLAGNRPLGQGLLSSSLGMRDLTSEGLAAQLAHMRAASDAAATLPVASAAFQASNLRTSTISNQSRSTSPIMGTAETTCNNSFFSHSPSSTDASDAASHRSDTSEDARITSPFHL